MGQSTQQIIETATNYILQISMDASCCVYYTISLLIPSQHNNNKVRNIVLDGTLLHVLAFGSHHQANTLNMFSNY
jgi:hypothetical protein